jgi:hypothetical protein
MKRNHRPVIFVIILLICIPLAVMAAVKKHPFVQLDQDCFECHASQQEDWQKGKHSEMGVQCVVCHGSLDKDFYVQPPIDRCAGCHDDKVNDLKKKKSASLKCSSCHDKHTLTVKTKTPFHTKGGK